MFKLPARHCNNPIFALPSLVLVSFFILPTYFTFYILVGAISVPPVDGTYWYQIQRKKLLWMQSDIREHACTWCHFANSELNLEVAARAGWLRAGNNKCTSHHFRVVGWPRQHPSTQTGYAEQLQLSWSSLVEADTLFVIPFRFKEGSRISWLM